MKKMIDLFIVGTQKSGTTSLLAYLGEHPEVLRHPQQEMSFFVSDQEYARGYANAFRHYFSEGSSKKPATRCVVAKHASLCHRDTAIERLHAHNPDCKLVMTIRNPVERAYSSYLMEKTKGHEDQTFGAAIKSALEDPSTWKYRAYLGYGMYCDDVLRTLKHFEKRALTVVTFEELKANPVAVAQSVFSTLGVEPTFAPAPMVHNEASSPRSTSYARFIDSYLLNNKARLNQLARKLVAPHQAAKLGSTLRRLNKSTKKPDAMPSDVREFLVAFYKPHNDRLSELLQQDFSRWDI